MAVALAGLLTAVLLLTRPVAAADGSPTGSPATETAGEDAIPAINVGQALVLGVVEGVTEFLPVSSTGHLLVTGRLMDLDRTDAAKEAFDSYAIAIQAGAIIAVLAR